MSITPVISIIIPTMDREAILFDSLAHLSDAVKGFSVEVIVINDSKTSNLVLNTEYDFVRVVNNPGKGVASARNFGASIAKSELLWFVDDDMWIGESLFKRALELHQKFPDSVFNFNWIYPEYLSKKIALIPFGRFLEDINFTTMKGWCRGNFWDDNELFKTDWLAGATLLISKTTYAKVNGYDSSFPLAGFEDYDFSVRVKKAGITSYIEPNYMAYHNEVNKTSLRGFLTRVRNNAITRKHGVSIGYKDQELKISLLKRTIYQIIGVLETPLLFICDNWPNLRAIDFLYFRLCHILIGYNGFKGYSTGK
jgi:GT2 family glycosyltransferase